MMGRLRLMGATRLKESGDAFGSSMHLMATLRRICVSHATCTVAKPPAPASDIGR